MGWDQGIDWKEARRELRRLYRESRGRRRVYFAALLLQLVNGLRVREAWRALQHYVATGETEFYLKPGKGGSPRPVVVPQEIRLKKREREELAWILRVPPEAARKRLHYYARRYLGSNTHSLRYALVGFLAKNGVAPQLIAKITGHRKLSRIVDYTQAKVAEELLRNLA